MVANVVTMIMIIMKTILSIIILLTFIGCRSNRAYVQSNEELQDVINMGHYPWVLVNIRFNNDPPRIVCMKEYALSMAIYTELKLLKQEPSDKNLRNVLKEGATSGFVFTKEDAWVFMPPPCDPEKLRRMRKILQPISDEELMNHEDPMKLMLSLIPYEDDMERVFAQVLIERRFRTFNACFNGALTIWKSKDWHNKTD